MAKAQKNEAVSEATLASAEPVGVVAGAPVVPVGTPVYVTPSGDPVRYLTFTEKLSRCMAACGYVQKDQVNSFHKYKYASADAVLSKFRDAASKYGLAIVRSTSELIKYEAGEAVVRIEIEISDGKESAVFSGYGQGSDKGDKAIMKANTAALKYAFAAGFAISWGDDPEADEETDRRAEAPASSAPKPQSGVDWNAYAMQVNGEFMKARTAADVERIVVAVGEKVNAHNAPEPAKRTLAALIRSARERAKSNGASNGNGHREVVENAAG